jgi:protease IV
MSRSTKIFIVITGILMIIGFGMWMMVYLIFTSGSDNTKDVVTGSGERIAVVELSGVIVSSDETVRQFKKYREDRGIRGILFRIDSPGGGVVASQEIYEEVKKTKNSGKPVVVSMGSLGASGGYYVACPANRIVANPGTLTGSIGVISQFMEYDSLLGKIGVGVNTIKSGKLKDAGNPFRPMTIEDKEYFQNLMDNVHRQFIAAVENERHLPHDSVVALADGRVFTGEQALGLGLIDTLGTYEDAIAITAKIARIKGTPSIVKERKRTYSLFDRVLGETKFSELVKLKDEIFNQPILQYKLTHGL